MGRSPDEAVRVCLVGGIENDLACETAGGLAVVDHGRGQQARARSDGARRCTRGRTAGRNGGRPGCSRSDPGNSGRYFMVRNWLSEYGLSSETYGRLWVLVTPRSAIRKAAVWTSSTPAVGMDGELARRDLLFLQECSMRCLASSALSRSATIQPTT